MASAVFWSTIRPRMYLICLGAAISDIGHLSSLAQDAAYFARWGSPEYASSGSLFVKVIVFCFVPFELAHLQPLTGRLKFIWTARL